VAGKEEGKTRREELRAVNMILMPSSPLDSSRRERKLLKSFLKGEEMTQRNTEEKKEKIDEKGAILLPQITFERRFW